MNTKKSIALAIRERIGRDVSLKSLYRIIDERRDHLILLDWWLRHTTGSKGIHSDFMEHYTLQVEEYKAELPRVPLVLPDNSGIHSVKHGSMEYSFVGQRIDKLPEFLQAQFDSTYTNEGRELYLSDIEDGEIQVSIVPLSQEIGPDEPYPMPYNIRMKLIDQLVSVNY